MSWKPPSLTERSTSAASGAAATNSCWLRRPTRSRMYLRDIGKVPLLKAAQEVDLAMRIEAGGFAAELIATIDAAPAKVDQKQFRRVVSSVVTIREHQLDPEKRLRNEGIGQEKVPRTYRPKTRKELMDFTRPSAVSSRGWVKGATAFGGNGRPSSFCKFRRAPASGCHVDEGQPSAVAA
jgi:Sigma-70 factor, region 1.2